MDTTVQQPAQGVGSAGPRHGKYIRTFAGDMAVMQGGGTPDLKPLQEQGNTENDSNVAVSLQSAVEGLIPEQDERPTIRKEEIEVPVVPEQPDPAERLIAGSPLSPVEEVQIPPEDTEAISTSSAPEDKPKPKEALRVETYAGDFAQQIKDSHASFGTVLAQEQDAGPRAAAEEAPKLSLRTVLLVAAGIFLLIVGGVGVYVAYVKNQEANVPVIVQGDVRSPIFVEEKETISGSGVALLQAFEQLVTRPLADGSVRLVYTKDGDANGNLFSMLPFSAPSILLRNIDTDGSVAGVINVNGVQTPFFILLVTSYRDTFAGMLSWERLMSTNLAPLFPAYIDPITTASSTQATTTTTGSVVGTQSVATSSLPTLPVIQSGFQDQVVNNRDVRVYRDTANRTVLLYGYWNQRTLIIARNEGAFIGIVNRLAATRASQ